MKKEEDELFSGFDDANIFAHLHFLFFAEIDILVLYVPILINLLIEDAESLKYKSSPKCVLHSYALQKLIAIGPAYPQEFRQIINQVPAFRTKLEAAVRNQANLQNTTNRNGSTTGGGGSGGNRSQSTRNDNPIIKLKTDFSNYTDKK